MHDSSYVKYDTGPTGGERYSQKNEIHDYFLFKDISTHIHNFVLLFLFTQDNIKY